MLEALPWVQGWRDGHTGGCPGLRARGPGSSLQPQARGQRRDEGPGWPGGGVGAQSRRGPSVCCDLSEPPTAATATASSFSGNCEMGCKKKGLSEMLAAAPEKRPLPRLGALRLLPEAQLTGCWHGAPGLCVWRPHPPPAPAPTLPLTPAQAPCSPCPAPPLGPCTASWARGTPGSPRAIPESPPRH